MHSSDRVLARRYAEALFLSAAEQKQEEKTRQELAEAYKALAPKLAALKSPTVPPAEKKQLVQKAAPAGSKTARFLELLIDKKRASLLPAIVSDLGRLADEKAGRIRAQVRSAAELSPEDSQGLAQRLKKFAGKDVVLDVKVDPELLAGVIVRMGDTVLDASLQGKLKNLAARLVEE